MAGRKWIRSNLDVRRDISGAMKTAGIVGGLGPESTIDSGSSDVEFLDTTVIHVEAVVDELLR